MTGQRQLHKNAVNRIVVVERIDEIQYLVLGHVFGQRVLHGMKTAGFGTTLLVADIHLAGRVFADDHNSQARPNTVFAEQRRGLLCDGLGELFGFGLAVNTFSGHLDRSMLGGGGAQGTACAKGMPLGKTRNTVPRRLYDQAGNSAASSR